MHPTYIKVLSCSFQSNVPDCHLVLSKWPIAIVVEVKMPIFVEMNCVELLAGSRVEVSSYSRNSVIKTVS